VADTTAVESYLDLSPAGKQLLRNGLANKRFARPTPVIHKGQRVSGAYLVTRGQLRVFTFTPQGTEATLYFIRPGETCVLALNCLFNDLLYPAWVEANADTEVALIPGPLYRSLFEREAGVQDMTVKALSTLVFRLMGDQRLANFLLSNADAAGTLRMTQQELAGHLGTTREVIARLMQGFVARGLVASGRGAVTVRDSEQLSNLVKHRA